MRILSGSSKKFLVGLMFLAALQFNVASASEVKFIVIDDVFNPGITSVVIEGNRHEVDLELMKRKHELIKEGILDSVSVFTNLNTNYSSACLDICDVPQNEVGFVETRFFEGNMEDVDAILINSSNYWEVCHYYVGRDGNLKAAELALIKAVD